MLKEKELQSCTSVAGNTSSLFLPGDSKLGVLFLWVGGGGGKNTIYQQLIKAVVAPVGNM